SLAAAAGVDLRFDNPHGTTERLRRVDGFLRREGGHAARHRHAEVTQDVFRLIFVNVHHSPNPRPWRPQSSSSVQCQPRFGAIFLQASTSVCTDCADFSKASRSPPFNSISTTRSTPLAPITTGTPTYRSL